MKMDKFKIVWITLLILTLAMIGDFIYCEGTINWVESHFGPQGDIFVEPDPFYLKPYETHLRFLEHAWIGFALLSVLWTAFGFMWLISKKPKFKVAPIAPTVATLLYLMAESYIHYTVEELRYPLLTYFYLRLGFLALVLSWILLGLCAVFPDLIMGKRLSIIFAIFGFLLISVGISIPELFFLAWIGVWIVIACLVFEFYRWRKEMKKEGKEIIL